MIYVCPITPNLCKIFQKYTHIHYSGKPGKMVLPLAQLASEHLLAPHQTSRLTFAEVNPFLFVGHLMYELARKSVTSLPVL